VADEGILGGAEFVERARREVEQDWNGRLPGGWREVALRVLVEQVCRTEGVSLEGVGGGGRRPELCRVGESIVYLWVEWLGHSGRQLAQPLGVRPESVYKAARRVRREAERWQSGLES